MKLALNGATTMRADLATDLLAAQTAGYDYLEIWAAKLRAFLKQNSVADLQALFNKHQVPPLSINSIEHITFRDETAYQQIKQQCHELCSIAAQINCPYVVVVPGRLPASGANETEIKTESVRVLNQLADIAAAYNVSLAFEFLGQKDCSVQTLAQANEIVKAVDRQNVGLIIDSFHFYAGGSSIDMIESVAPDSIYVFHLNDSEDRPREELEDRHRLYPGSGILPLNEMFRAFRRIGYDRVASIEIFRPEYWDMDPIRVARAARLAATGVMEKSAAVVAQ
ncbi:MAG TPA: sugar phosphate isomerase/epimerase family protein [Pyrinomonadaceae bacterium]|nr:sugar phosphate isomerase/epimerase family protein [Pyrinomonadaceae bacterium]